MIAANSKLGFTTAIIVCLSVACEAWMPQRFRSAIPTSALTLSSPISIGRRQRNSPLFSSSQATSSSSLLSSSSMGRRQWISVSGSAVLSSLATTAFRPDTAKAFAEVPIAADVTDKVFVDIKGLPAVDGQPSGTRRIVIGLFGKDSPRSVSMLKSLMSDKGLATKCKPKEEKLLQKDQLEANKIYNNCIEAESLGVNYDYAQVWRIQKNKRIDFGSLAGRFIARESPTWEEKEPNKLKHDRPYLVSVKRGNDSGFSFTIYPGGDDTKDLDDNQIILGQVIEGMEVIDTLNEVPIVKSANINYMALTGGASAKDAPTRACYYGGSMYCNEFKPLVKLQMYRTGIL